MTDTPVPQGQPEGAARAARQSFPALRHAGFRNYLIVSALAMMADSIEHVISYWIMFQKFHSPALGGYAILSHWLPFLFFGVYVGGLADRFDTRRIIQIGMACFMTASLSWGFLFLTDSLQIWHAVLILTIHGCGSLMWGPASQLLLHDIVGPAHLQSAVRLNATARYLGLLMGPAVGGAILLALGPTNGIFLNVLIYLPLVLFLWKAPYGPKFRTVTAQTRRALRGFADIAATIRAVLGNPVIVSMTLLAGGYALFIGNAYQAQMPEYAHDLGHGDGGFLYSILLGADAAGALTAGILLEMRGLLQARARTALILAMLWCFAIAGFAMAPYYPLALALLFVAGFLELSFNAMAQTLVQIHAPPAIRGSVIGLYGMFAMGLRAFGGVTVGMGGALIGVHWSLGLSAAGLLILITGLMAVAMRPVPATASAE